jgi:hypothetical protein
LRLSHELSLLGVGRVGGADRVFGGRATRGAAPGADLGAGDGCTADAADGGRAPAVVLLDEWNHEVLPDGRAVLTVRHAVRILNRSGAEQASASVFYQDKADSVKTTDAWLVREGKAVTPPKKREWADVSAASNGAIFDESRKRTISYEDVVCLGDVFAYETRIERRMLFGQVQNRWHSTLPTLVDRFILRLPPGWSCEVVARTGNAVGLLQEKVEGQTRTWELFDRPYRPDEPAMADGARLDALVAVNFVPPKDAAGSALFVPRDWAARGLGLEEQPGQCDTNAALAAEARRLTADCADQLARIRALSRAVQQLRYVGVNKNLAIGHGYRPQKATEVFAEGGATARTRPTCWSRSCGRSESRPILRVRRLRMAAW